MILTVPWCWGKAISAVILGFYIPRKSSDAINRTADQTSPKGPPGYQISLSDSPFFESTICGERERKNRGSVECTPKKRALTCAGQIPYFAKNDASILHGIDRKYTGSSSTTFREKRGVFEPRRTSKCPRHSRAHPCVKSTTRGVLRKGTPSDVGTSGRERKETEQKQTTTTVK